MSKSTSGHGSIRKKTVTRNGKTYHYWEARYTAGYGENGRQIQKSVTGKTQKEVADKLREITESISSGSYIDPSKMTVRQWCKEWEKTYLCKKKIGTQKNYISALKNHILPQLGHIRLQRLTHNDVQRFANSLDYLTTGSIKNIVHQLSTILEAAKKSNYIKENPARDISFPASGEYNVNVLSEDEIRAFIAAIRGSRFENIYLVSLFTGMRESEVLGLTWDGINFDEGIINLDHQLITIIVKQYKNNPDMDIFSAPKNGKARTIKPPAFVMKVLQNQRALQSEQSLEAGSSFDNRNNLVFCDGLGHPITQNALYLEYKRLMKDINPRAKLHDLRHTYAVAAIRSGIDYKTISDNLGHASVSFTLDVYAKTTMEMQKEAAEKLEAYIAQLIS